MSYESLAGTISDVVQSYRHYLGSKANPDAALTRFNTLLVNNVAAAHAEAAVFDFLDLYQLQPRVFEDASTGGPDFECRYGKQTFAVEVTSIGDDTLTRRSGMSNVVVEVAASFIDVPNLIRAFDSCVSAKTAKGQARVYTGPQVLAIVTTHVVSSIVPLTIQSFATTAFCKGKDGNVTPARRAYALVLFVQITGDASFIAGAIHPEPVLPLSIEPFHRIPFARVSNWHHRTASRLMTEWVVSQPDAHKVIYLPIQLRRL
jgi:hypothetical protein